MPSAQLSVCRKCGRLAPKALCAACAQGTTGPKRWHGLYGYRWQRESKVFLLEHPIAVDWFNEHKGVIYLAEVVDHVIPHRGDLKLFWDHGNWQGLTKADHDRKTALEDGGFGRVIQSGNRMG